MSSSPNKYRKSAPQAAERVVWKNAGTYDPYHKVARRIERHRATAARSDQG